MLPVKCQEVEVMAKELSIHGIGFIQGFTDKLKKTVQKKEGNSIVFLVRMGYFAISLSLLKVHKSVSEFRRKKLAGGAFSDVFFERVGKKEYAIKSQKIKEEDRLAYTSNLDAILKEYFFFKIAAILGFGPEMENIFGYDLVCYNDRI